MEDVSSIAKYLGVLTDKLKTGQAREHAYRTAFEALIKSLDPSLHPINDPSRSEYGNPDFVFLRGDITAGYAETKDIGVDLNKTEKTQQMERYLGYSNLILTDYLEFRFFRNGERYGEPIVIGVLVEGAVKIHEENFGTLANTLKDFLQGEPEPIKSGKRLAKIMGGKARRIRDNVIQFLAKDSDKNAELERVYQIIKELLVHDLSKEKFADMYAQTLVYGLFVARFHDDTPGTFTRQEARDLVPASNPFLRHFFDHIVGPDFDKRLGYIVTELCDVFSCTDIQMLMGQYFNEDDGIEGPDPVVHFYEDFLREYDAEQRKKLGAFYTPLPVVRFIVRALDVILEKEFGLAQGLADTTKVEINKFEQAVKVKETVHRVQILDPAAGTGTFLNETVRAIHARFKDQAGRWKAYVNDDLLPRLHGFELMMAPYTIAHLKLGMMLKETGYEEFSKRLGVYLTNSLEEAQTQGDLFSLIGLSRAIAEEAKQASYIKNERPIMVVLGNPPYSVSSSNKGEWIQGLIRDYKEGLNERKINLDDDYIKFIHFAEHFIEKNNSGVVAMITNNSFIDGITHRHMRKHLLETFNTIYILDLHGNAKKKETAPDGSKDENVFDIQQGVSIALFVRNTKQKSKLGKVYHAGLFGKRQSKFNKLSTSDIETMKWKKLDYREPYYFFVPKDFAKEEKYKQGISVSDFFNEYNSGIQTKKDSLAIQFTQTDLEHIVSDFQELSIDELRTKYTLKDSSGWKVSSAKENIMDGDFKYIDILYRPFDTRKTIFTRRSGGFIGRPRARTMKHMLAGRNLGLITNRQIVGEMWSHVGATKLVNCHGTFYLGNKGQDYLFPLYLYTEDGTRVPNLKRDIVKQIEAIVGESTPEDIFDYIYAVLHSPSYREKYREFLKIDFPRVPYPKDLRHFRSLVELGREMRSLHLLESPRVNKFTTTYPISGSNIVEKLEYKDGSVYINKDQYFGKVPDVAWNFWVGGYQPVQKWLKDRKGRELSNAEIEHYQKMIVALAETSQIMKKINDIT